MYGGRSGPGKRVINKECKEQNVLHAHRSCCVVIAVLKTNYWTNVFYQPTAKILSLLACYFHAVNYIDKLF